MNIGSVARITWLKKQIERCSELESTLFNKIGDKIWIEADVKFARTNLKVSFKDIEELYEQSKGKEIQGFNVSVMDGFGASFASENFFLSI